MLKLITQSIGYITLITLSYILKRIGIFSKKDKDVLGKLLMYIMLPCAFVSNFSSFTKIKGIISFILIGLGANILLIITGRLMSRKKNNKDRAMYVIECSGYNIGAFTIPFVSSFLSESDVIVASLFDIGNSIMCIGGVYPLAKGFVEKIGSRKENIKTFLKNLFKSVPFDTYLIMLTISLLGMRLPEMVNSIAHTIGKSSIIITMIMIGIAFEINVSKEDILDIIKIIIIRYGVSLIIALMILKFFNFEDSIKKVLIISIMAPSTSISPTYCNLCKCNSKVYGAVSSLTVPISIAIFILIMTTI